MDNITEIIIINPESDNFIENIDQVENTIDENSLTSENSSQSNKSIELSTSKTSLVVSDENTNYVLTNHIIYKVIMEQYSLMGKQVLEKHIL